MVHLDCIWFGSFELERKSRAEDLYQRPDSSSPYFLSNGSLNNEDVLLKSSTTHCEVYHLRCFDTFVFSQP